jgi:hypothetical protein
MVGGNRSGRIQAYRMFVEREDDRELVRIFSGKRWPALLGSEKFIDGVKRRFVGKESGSRSSAAKGSGARLGSID